MLAEGFGRKVRRTLRTHRPPRRRAPAFRCVQRGGGRRHPRQGGGGTMKRFVPIGLLVLGAVIGVSVGMALGQTINCSHGTAFCQGTNEADNISGWENPNNIFAKAGRDQVWAFGSLDNVYAGEDGDNANGGEGEDYVYGEAGNDSPLYVAGAG